MSEQKEFTPNVVAVSDEIKGVYGEELQDWYTRINSILTRDEQPIITPPTTLNQPILFEHAKALKNKLEEMKTDEFYSKATYSDLSSIQENGIVLEENGQNLEDTIKSIETTIICRNTLTYKNGSNNNSIRYNGTCTYGTCQNEKYLLMSHENGWKSNGYESNEKHFRKGTYTNSYSGHTQQCYADCNYGTKENGKNTFGEHSNGTFSNEYKENGKNSYTSHSNGSYNNGTKDNGTEMDVSNSKKSITK